MASRFSWRKGDVEVTDDEVVISDSAWFALKKVYRQSRLVQFIVVVGILVFGISLALPSERRSTILLLMVAATVIGAMYLARRLAPKFTSISDEKVLQRDTIEFVELHSGGRIVAPKVVFVVSNERKRSVNMSLAQLGGTQEFEEATRIIESAGFDTRLVE